MNKQLIKGTIVGVIAPIAAFVVYVAFFSEDPNPVEMYKALVKMNILGKAMSLSVLINLLLFFMNIKTHRDEAARGILLATILYGITILIITIT